MKRLWALFFLSAAFALVARCQEEQTRQEDDESEVDESHHLTVEKMKILHAQIDADNDGKMSLPEIIAFSHEMRQGMIKKDLPSILEELDSDRNGKVSLEELSKDMPQTDADLERQKFKVADADEDGELDSDEVLSIFYSGAQDAVLELSTAHTMKTKDTNGDNELSPQEFYDGYDHGQGHNMEMGDFSEEEKKTFLRLDVDKSASISLSELKPWEDGVFHVESAMKDLFEIADKDKDSSITFDEFDSAYDRIAGTDIKHYFAEWADHLPHTEL